MDEEFKAKPLVPPLAWFLIISLSVVIGSYYYISMNDLRSKYERDVVNANSSVNWKSTVGQVKQLDVIKMPDPFSSTRSHIDHFQPVISYEYEIDNHRYQSNQISFPNPSFEQKSEATKYANQYNIGNSIELFYNPKSPEQSCIVRGITPSLKKTFFWRADESHNSE